MAGDTVNILDTIAVNTLPNGFNKLGVRFKDSLDRWSQTFTRTFLKTFTDNSDNPRLIACEYFFNSDPGIGNGTEITIVAGDTVNILDTIAVNTLPNGFNKLGVRFKDSLDRWSQTFTRTFLKTFTDNSDNPRLIACEYFFNSDPGIGNGTEITIVASDTVNILDTIAVNTLSTGFNKLGVRFKDSLDRWSQTFTRTFLKSNMLSRESVKIVAAELVYDTEKGFGSGKPLKITKGYAINTVVMDSLKKTLELGVHRLSLRVQDSLGRWSFPVESDFTVCEIDGPLAGFDYISYFNSITLIDQSENSEKYEWYNSDNILFDTLVNPKLNDMTPGKHTIKQKVINMCGSDVVTKDIYIMGVRDFKPDKLGKNIKSTLVLNGFGFNNGTEVDLLKINGQDTIIINQTNSKISYDKTKLYVTYNLNNAEKGHYNILIKKLDYDTLLTFNAAIEIIDKADPLIRTEILSNNIIRGGRELESELIIKNYGNIDDINTRVFVIGIAGDTSIQVSIPNAGKVDSIIVLNPPKIKPSTNSQLQSDDDKVNCIVESFDHVVGEYKSIKFAPILVTGLYASGEKRIPFRSYVPTTVTAHSKYKYIVAEITKYNNPSDLSIEPVIDDNSVYNDYYTDSDVGHASVINLITNFIRESIKRCNEPTVNPPQFYFSPYVSAGGPRGVIKNGQQKIQSDDTYICTSPEIFNQELIQSGDPNKKIGPSSRDTVNNYFQSTKKFFYSVYFENLETATASVQEIIITDSLDKSIFNLNTFEFGNFTIADSTYLIPNFVKEFSLDIDLPETDKIFLRVNAKLDTSNGIIRWHFIAMDPKTGKLTNDPVLGFLPPNINPTEGEGHVKYRVDLRDSVADGTIIKNKAKIIFDVNDPIYTNEWTVSIDDNHPTSMIKTTASRCFDTTLVLELEYDDQYGAIDFYDIFVSTNNGEYVLYDRIFDTNQYVFKGGFDSAYKFYSIAVDFAGNIEDAKTGYDTYTTITKLLPPQIIAPANLEKFVDVKPKFEWNEAEYAESYQLQICDKSDFVNSLYDIDSLATTNYQLTDSLNHGSKYYFRLRTINGTSQSDWSTTHLFTVMDKPINVPDNWSFKDTTGSSSNIVVPFDINPEIGFRDIISGDAIGLFFNRNDSLICGGYGLWDNQDLNIRVWGDDNLTTLKDGFEEDELYTFKVWDAQKQVEYVAKAEYESGPNSFINNSESILSSLTSTSIHTINLAKGWNMISTYNQAEYDSIAFVLKPVVDNLVIAKNQAGLMYLPSKSIDLIKKWNVRQGYMVYMKDKDTLNIKGIPIPKDSLLYLAKGWNMIAYTRTTEQAIATALVGLNSNFIIVKNGAGLMYLPSKNINLIGNMKPGAGYMIYMTVADTLDYPEGSGKRTVDELVKLPTHLIAKSSPYNMNVIIETNLPDECEIGAYNTNDKLVGSGIVENCKAAVTIFADDENTMETDGANADEAITFKAYNPKNDFYENFGCTEIQDLVSEKMLTAINYSTNTVLTAKAATELKTGEDYNISIYPNPTKNKIELQINFSSATEADIKVYNLQGNKLISVYTGNLPQGETKLQINCESLSNGTFNVVIQMKDRSITKRFVVAR